jgi:hypothetical protein
MSETTTAWRLLAIALLLFTLGFSLGSSYQRSQARAYYKELYDLQVSVGKLACDVQKSANDWECIYTSWENDRLRVQLLDRELQCSLDGYELVEDEADDE